MKLTDTQTKVKQTIHAKEKSQADNPCKREGAAEDENGHHIPFSEFWCK